MGNSKKWPPLFPLIAKERLLVQNGASFMIREENLPRLKKHLMGELQRTVDLFLDEDGDSLVSLVGLALKNP